ncbi:copper chaperone PCu(A)C [Roseobacter weihaiensis]|uniref:copper chaperone PCu(A)C n=1 Tax=Roseobacter weihaiensis TaxID=2763262 RepID=UPI001D099FA6|nr:copper chaperone PCu(A)C [Roseobacter sp. H9]
MKRTVFAFCAALTCAGTSLVAHEFTSGTLTIDHPMAFETARTAMSAGGYMTITNSGTEADQLVGVEADFPKVMLHTTEEKDGIARMMHVHTIEIPAGETVALEPGGLHVMFMGLNGDPFEVGEEIPATLMFERAGPVEVVFKVEARGADGAGDIDHSNHGVGQSDPAATN